MSNWVCEYLWHAKTVEREVTVKIPKLHPIVEFPATQGYCPRCGWVHYTNVHCDIPAPEVSR